MSVKLTNFVKINIRNHKLIGSISTRDTAAVIRYMAGATNEDVILTDASSNTFVGIQDFVDKFFDHGGKKLHVYTAGSTDFSSVLDSIPTEEIAVAMINDATEGNVPLDEATFRGIAEGYNTSKEDEGIDRKLFVVELESYNGFVNDPTYANKAVSQENYIIKYGAQGIGASILAYLTNINIDNANAAQDYCFTSEVYSGEGYVFDDNDVVEFAMENNINIDTHLAGSVKVVNGNDTAGYSITNQYMLILVQQVLTNALIQVLTSKIKYNTYGLNAVMTRVIAELNRFVSNGYLSVDKVWNDGDLYYKNYKIIGKNTPLTAGFQVTILPFDSLSPAELEAKQLPNIFVLLADSYFIRKIVIDGEVF